VNVRPAAEGLSVFAGGRRTVGRPIYLPLPVARMAAKGLRPTRIR
jgi:hypothetical protein